MKIKVLGSGCANCNKLKQMVFDVLADSNIDANVDFVKDIKEIMSYGVMSTPALVINGQVKLAGSVPPKAKLVEIIKEAAKRD